MRKLISVSTFGAVCLSLAGCTGSTNPETATLFDNINNLNSGEYDRQIAANKAEANAILANNRAAERRISSLEAQRASNSRAISSLKGQVSSARSAASAARSAAAGDPAKLAQVRALDAQLASVSAEINSGAADPGVARSELRRISSAYKAISG